LADIPVKTALDWTMLHLTGLVRAPTSASND
jgi:hypothetical protein